jgi:hypothetical protein
MLHKRQSYGTEKSNMCKHFAFSRAKARGCPQRLTADSDDGNEAVELQFRQEDGQAIPHGAPCLDAEILEEWRLLGCYAVWLSS